MESTGEAEKSGGLRQNFFRFLHRSCRVAEEQGHGLAAYRSIAGLVYRLCGDPWVQDSIFPLETELMRRFLRETNLPVADAKSALQKNLMSCSWKVFGRSIVRALSSQDFASLCTVSGMENLTSAQGTGRGIVLAHSHTVPADLFWTWLEYEGIAPGVLIWQWSRGKDRGVKRDPRIRVLETARELRAAVGTLRQGGMVHVMADGDKGSRGIVLTFCNRRRPFETTFAELALDTNALILTVDVNLAVDGGISIEIGPLSVDSPRAPDRSCQVEQVVRPYADHLYRRWKTHPGDMQLFVYDQHLALPAI